MDNYIRPGNKTDAAAPLCETRWEVLVETQLRPTGSYTRYWSPENFRNPAGVIGQPEEVTVFPLLRTPAAAFGSRDDPINLVGDDGDYGYQKSFSGRQPRPYFFTPAKTNQNNKRKERQNENAEQQRSQKRRHRADNTPRTNTRPGPTQPSTSRPSRPAPAPAPAPAPVPPARLPRGSFAPGTRYEIWVGHPKEQDDRPEDGRRQAVYGSFQPNGQVQFKARGWNVEKTLIPRKFQRRGGVDIPVEEITWRSRFASCSTNGRAQLIALDTLRSRSRIESNY